MVSSRLQFHISKLGIALASAYQMILLFSGQRPGHTTLTDKLANWYGVSGVALDWFSYLKDRCERLKIKDNFLLLLYWVFARQFHLHFKFGFGRNLLTSI